MNTLEPRQSHPLYWVLVEVLGVQPPTIMQRAGVSRSTIRRMQDGQQVRAVVAVALADLVTAVVQEIVEDGVRAASYERPDGSRGLRDCPEMFAEHRRHCLQLAQRVAHTFARPQSGRRPFSGPRSERGRQCFDRLTAVLGRSDVCDADAVVRQLVGEGFSRTLVYQAAGALKVVRETHGFGREKRTLWALPKPLKPAAPAVLSIVRDS